MKNFTKLSAASLFAATLMTPAAFAQDKEFYVDGGVGQVSVEDFDFTVVNGHLGFKFGQYFGLEGEIGLGLGDEGVSLNDLGGQDEIDDLATQLGINPSDITVGGDASLTRKFGAFGTVGTTLDNGLEVFGRVGVVSAELKVTGTASYLGQSLSVSNKDSGTALAYGIGGKYYFTGPNGIRFDITKYEVGDEADATEIAVGYTRRF